MESLPTSPNPSPPTTIEFKPDDAPEPTAQTPPNKCTLHTMNWLASQQELLALHPPRQRCRLPQQQPESVPSNQQPVAHHQPAGHSRRQHGFLATRSSNRSSRPHPFGSRIINWPVVTVIAERRMMQQHPCNTPANSRISLTMFADQHQPPSNVSPHSPATPQASAAAHHVDNSLVAAAPPTTSAASAMPTPMAISHSGCPVQPKIQVNPAVPITLDSPVQIQSQPGLVRPVNAALLADRYLLLEPLKGTSLYKCIDVRTYRDLVCKVSQMMMFFLLKKFI